MDHNHHSCRISLVNKILLTILFIYSIRANLQPNNTNYNNSYYQVAFAQSGNNNNNYYYRIPTPRILALFSESVNDLGIDHRLGKQVLRVAVQRAKQLNPRLQDIELIFVVDHEDCSSLNTIPEQVVNWFYSQEKVCTRRINNGTTSSADILCEAIDKRANLASERAQLASYASHHSSTTRPRDRRAAPPNGPAETQETSVASSTALLRLGRLPELLSPADSDSLVDARVDPVPLSRGARATPAESASLSAGMSSNRMNKRQSIDAIIGPSCEFLVDLIARMAAYWRAPIYSVTSIGTKFSKKSVFSTLTRLSPSTDHLCMFILRTMERFQWRHLAIILDERQVDSRLVYQNLEQTIARNRYQIPIERRKFSFDSFRNTNSSAHFIIDVDGMTSISSSNRGTPSACSREAREVLLAAKRVARVFLFLINEFKVVRRLLLCAHELGFHNGEFTFLTLNLGLNSAQLSSPTSKEINAGAATSNENMADSPSSASHGDFGATKSEKNINWYDPNDLETNNQKARKMFESLMVYSAELPISKEYEMFVEQVLELTKREFPDSHFEARSVGNIAIALHDSLLIAIEAYVRQFQGALDVELDRLAFNVLARSRNELERTTTTESSLEIMNRYSINEYQDVSNMNETYKGLSSALLWNETFYDGLMPQLHINSNGDQELDYILSDLEPELAFMRPVASYSKETRQIYLLPTSFIHWPARLNALTKEPVSQERPPPDEPECGFNEDADHCIDRQNLYVALSIGSAIASLLILGVIMGFLRYRQIKYQLQLEDYWWQIEWSELKFVQLTGSQVDGGSLVSGGQVMGAKALKEAIASGSVVGGSQVSGHIVTATGAHPPSEQGKTDTKSAIPDVVVTDTQEAHDAATAKGRPTEEQQQQPQRQAKTADHNAADNRTEISGFSGPQSKSATGGFIILEDESSRIGTRSMFSSIVRESSLALYKEELVIVKLLNREAIEVSRELLVDLKAMRDHLSDNLAKFMGLCVDPGRLSIVYEFCSRGSLQDLLLNDSFDMDWTLKYSIIGDILNGLNYIHTTQLEFHGRLKSTNLVLDSRFTVKITDFGLQSLYSQIDSLDGDQMGGDYGDGDQESQFDAQSTVSGARDTLSLSVSQVGYNSNRSNSGRTGARAARDSEAVRRNRANFKGRHSARHLWTAPEHLRGRDSQIEGSKRGDVYSLAIVFSEIFTRREPYHFGSNARPNWTAIKAERSRWARLERQRRVSNASHIAGSRGGSISESGSIVGSLINKGAKQVKSKMKRLSSTVGVAADPETISIGSAISNEPRESSSTQRKESNVGQLAPNRSVAGDRRRSTTHRLSRSTIDDLEPNSTIGSGSTSKRDDQETERVDVDEILDQLRMSVQPEPVRPYLPNFIIQEIDPRLLELMRSCWNESAIIRPNLTRIRAQLKAITKGQTARNYLDNLLDRLQKYASDLERILDEKSGDIVGEKQKTEQMLYQLVPRFVADRLKRNEPIIPQQYECVTIYFSDIINFEKYANILSPVDLVQLLNSLYFAFDSIIENFDVHKIETILDIYLIAAGIKLDNQTSFLSQQNDNMKTNAIEADNNAELSNNEQQQQQQLQNTSGASKSRAKILNKSKILASLRNKNVTTTTKGGTESTGEEGAQQTTITTTQDLDDAETQQLQQQMIANDSKAASVLFERSAAEQIARMALSIRDMITSFRFSPSSTTQAAPINLNIRIGIHSGRVCAGIVGVKRPKFCLIGDTVNVASRMHTNSKANKIQISSNTRQLLEHVSAFDIQTRGKIEIKGKGQMDTFWLEYAR